MFDKHHDRAFPGATTVEKICRERGYYNAVAPHGQITLEEAFHPLEDAFREISTKIIREKSLAGLTPGEFASLTVFETAQFLRVPRMRAAFDQMSKLVAAKASSIAADGANMSEIEAQLDENQLRLRHLEAIARGAVETAKALSTYGWFVMESDARNPMWLSDCPVVLHNDEKSIYSGLGLNAPGVQICMPLTPHLQIACWHPVVVGQFMEKPAESRRLLGALKAQNLLGVRPDKARLGAAIAEIEKKLKPIDEIIAAIQTRSSTKISCNHVVHFNWLQFKWSHRFIMCREGKFSMARRMLKEHPDLKTGIGIEDGAAPRLRGGDKAARNTNDRDLD